MTTSPFMSTAYVTDDRPLPWKYAYLEPAVPTGKLLIVEHISGWVVVRQGYVVDLMQAVGYYGLDASGRTATWEVFLPMQFASQPFNFGGQLGVARRHQFGSPCRLYVSAGERIAVTAVASYVGELHATAIGHLVDP
jgi:hypothetical protein